MNVQLLIDAVVRQTMVLIAQLATSGGLRAPLAHVAGQAFLGLARELEGQGVSKKVSADMFGMALRTYQRRTQRLSLSRTDRGRSLWEAVLEFVERGQMVTREQVLSRFRHDDEASVRGVLRDLTESSVVFASGTGRSAVYRMASPEELRTLKRTTDRASLEALVWSVVYREGALSEAELVTRTGLSGGEVADVLEALVTAGRVERVADEDADCTEPRYRSRELVLGVGEAHGWEASVLDHFATLVQTITRKLALDQRAALDDEVGGSTYHLDLWRGHPYEDEVLGELRRFRERMTELRARLDGYNAAHGQPPYPLRVHAYYGQWVAEERGDEDVDDEDS